MGKNYYEILEVHPKASQEIIKKAYQTLAKKYHPDTSQLSYDISLKKMTELNEAYKVLSNSQKRQEYDKSFNYNHKNDNINPRYEKQESSEVELYQLCITVNEIIENINNRKESKKNRLLSYDNIAYEFERKSNQYLKKITIDNCNKDELYSKMGGIYLKLAKGYALANDYDKAETYAYKATRYIHKSSPLYKEAMDFNRNIENEKKRYEKKKYFCYAAVLIGALIIFSNISTSIKDSKTSSNSKMHETSIEDSHAKNKKQQLEQEVEHKPKKNVITGYDNSETQESFDGMCVLTIDNTKNDYPVYVRIWDLNVNLPVRAFFVNKREKFTAEQLNPGRYEVRYRTLYEDDYIPKGGFKSEPFDMEQIENDDGIMYSDIKLTLYKVTNGNTKITTISGDEV